MEYWQISYSLEFWPHCTHVQKDDQSKVENYSSIALLSALGNLLTSIFNNRLYSYLIEKDILKARTRRLQKKCMAQLTYFFI